MEVKGFEYRTFTDGCVSSASSGQVSTSGASGSSLQSPSPLGLFCSVLFEGEEQRTPATLDSTWNCPLEFGVDGTEQDEGLVVVVKERKETGKKGVLREDELGRVVVPLADLELMQARDHWYPLVTKTKGTTAAIRLVITYTFSRVDDLINIFSEPVRESAKPQKLSLSMLQYNIMRVIIALFPLFRIIKQLIDLFKWERPAASMLALLLFVFCCLFDFVASLTFALGSAHFIHQYVQHYRQRRLEQDVEADDELSKDAWKDWKAEKQKKATKEKGKEKERNKVKEKKAGIFTKMRRVQLISGKIADRIEPIRALWDWKDPKKSKAVMYILIFATILFLFVSFWLCFRYALLCLGVYMFTLNPLYNKFPRFKRRYHVSILIKRLKNQIIPHTVAFILVKLRLRNALSAKNKHLRLAELSKGCVQAGYLVKLSSVGNIWKRRYFVLKDTQLLYFNSSSPQEKLVAWIDLRPCGIINLENNLMKNRPYSFDLFDTAIPRHYLLAANDEKEKEEWVASFSMVLNHQPLLEGASTLVTQPSGASSTTTAAPPSDVPKNLDFLLAGASASASSSMTAAAKRQTMLLSAGADLTNPSAVATGRPRSRSDLAAPSMAKDSDADAEQASKQSKVTLGGLTDAARAGWIQKRGKNRKAWKTRYFVLSGITLYYFKKANMDSVPVGSIQLDGAKIFSIQGPKKGHQFCLGLYARTRYYLLSARDEPDRVAWLAAIKTVSGAPITSVDLNDDSDPDSDEAQPAAPANWVSGQVQERRTRFPSVSGSNIPVTTADKRRTQRTQSMRPRNSLPVSKRATVAFDQGVTFHDEKILVADLRENAKEGYLLRQEGKMRKTWRSRFVILAGDVLYIFGSSQAEEKVVDSIQLSNCSIYAVTGAIKGREHCIDIYRSQPSKHYLFGADDEKDRHAWISAIKHARGDKVLGETPEQELVRRERETASKLTATLNWMHQLIREDQVQDVLKLLQDADKETPGVEREDDITSRDLVRSREPQAGHTLLHVAAAHGQLRLVKELVEVYRADINKPDKQSWSPLHTAAHHSQIDVFEYLVDRGASLYTTTANGSSPLHYLVRFTRSSPRGRATQAEAQDVEDRLLEVVQKTIDLGADINATNRGGDTPLHLAAARPYFRLIKLLLENKANVSLRNQRGESPVDLAVKEGHEEIVALMRAYELVANDPTFARELNSPPPSHPARSQQRAMSLREEMQRDTVSAALQTTSVVEGGADQEAEPPSGGDAESLVPEKEITGESDDDDSSDQDTDDLGTQESASEPVTPRGPDQPATEARPEDTSHLDGEAQGPRLEGVEAEPAGVEEKQSSDGEPAADAPAAGEVAPTASSAGQRERSGGSFLVKSARPNPTGRPSLMIGGRANSALDVRLKLQSGSDEAVDSGGGGTTLASAPSESKPTQRAKAMSKPLPPPPQAEEGGGDGPFTRSKPLPAPPSQSSESLGVPSSAPQLRRVTDDEAAALSQQQITLGELSANKSNLFTGSLKSLSSVRKVWKRYHAVLADSSLYLYDSNAGSERVSKLMDVRKCQVLETPETKKERWCFDVCNHESKEHWLLATETEAEKNQWVEALRRVQGGSGAPSPSSTPK